MKRPSSPLRPRRVLSRHFISRLSSWLVLSTVLTVVTERVARAVTQNWDAVPGNGTLEDGAGIWSTTANNWTINAGVGNQFFANGDDAVFGGGTSGLAGTVALGENITVGSLLFNPAFAGNYTITGGTGPFGLTINAGVTTNTAATISSAVILGGAQTWSNTSSGLFSVSGNITNGGNNLTLGTSSTGGIFLSGIIGGTGAVTVNSTGSGAVTLSGANTFTGGVTLTAGTLNINHVQALGGVGTSLAIGGGTIDNASGAAITSQTNNPTQTWSGDFTFTGSQNLNLGTGAVGIGSGVVRTITVKGNDLTVGGVIGNATASSLTKAGAGRLILSAANTFGGVGQNFTLNAGTVQVAATATPFGVAGTTLVINGGGLDASAAAAPTANYAQTWGGDFAYVGTNTLNLGTGNVTFAATRQVNVIASSLTLGGALNGGTAGMTKAGAGTLILAGDSSAGYSGTTTIKGGTVQLNVGANSVTGKLNAATGLNFTGTGNFILSNTGATSGTAAQSLAASNFTAGEGSIQLNRVAAFNETLTVASVARSSGAVGLLASGGAASGTANGSTVKMVVTGQALNAMFAPGIFASVYTTVAPVYNFAWYDNTGFVRELNYATAAEGTSVAGGNLAGGANTGKNLRTTAAATLGASDNFNTLNINRNSAADLALGTGVTLTLGGTGTGALLRNLGSTTTISGGTGLTAGGLGNELIIRTDAATDAVTLTTPILSSTGAVTKSGLGTLNFGTTGTTGTTINNAFTGDLSITAGTLLGVGAGAFNANLVQTINLAGGATLNLREDGDKKATIQDISYGDNIALNGGGTATINLDRAGIPTGGLFLTPTNKNLQFGALSLDTQTLAITAVNNYGLEFLGQTTVGSTPTFNVGSNGATTSNVNPSLILTGKVTGTAGVVGSGYGLTKSGAGVMFLNNATNDFVGDVFVTGGVLEFASDGAFGAAGNSIYLNGAPSVLRAVGGGTFSTTRSIILQQGTAANNVFEVTDGTTFQINSAWATQNGFVKNDIGTLVLNADNGSWLGAVTINSGVLRITNNNALGSPTVGTNVGVTGTASAGVALQLAGVSIAEPLSIFGTGINSGGALQAVTGGVTNTSSISGLITVNTPGAAGISSTVGADAGATLNIQGGFAGGQVLGVAANGTVNITTTPLTSALGAITKLGNGLLNLQVDSSVTNAYVANIAVNAGTLTFSDAGKIGGTGTITIQPGSTLNVDNSGLNVVSRLGGRALTLAGANFNLIGANNAISTETVGAITQASGNTVWTLTANGTGQANLTAASIGAAATGSTYLIRGTNLGSAAGSGVATFVTGTTGVSFVGQSGATNTVNKGLLPWAIIDTTTTGLGSSFATTDGAAATGTVGAILRPLNSSEYVTSVTYGATANNLVLSGAETVNGSFTENSLTLNSGGGVTINPMQTLTLSSGGLLMKEGSAGITGGFLTVGTTQLFVYTPTATPANTTTIDSTILGTGGLAKAGAGVLSLTQSNFYTGTTTVNQGTLKLDAGTNTLVVGVGATGAAMVVNSGGTLDLNGNVQVIGNLSSQGAAASSGGGGGGIITSSTGTGILVANTSATFGGTISGANVSFMKSGTSGQTLTAAQTYGGATVITGGNLTVTDNGSLLNTSAVTVNYGTLLLSNSTMTLTNSSNRLNAAAPISLSGGTLSLYGRAVANVTQSVGAVTLQQGASFISASDTALYNTVAPNGATLTLASLSRNAQAGATVEFAQLYTNNSNGTLGSLNDGGGRYENILITAAPTLTNNIMGGWATVVPGYFVTSVEEFASYNPTLGVGALNQAGYAGYDGTVLPTVNQPNQNIRLTGNGTVVAGGLALNSLNFATNVAATNLSLNFAGASDKLTLNSGGLLVQNVGGNTNGSSLSGTMTIGATPNSGQVTSGWANGFGQNDLFLAYRNSFAVNALTFNSAIVDNGATPVRLVVSGGIFGAIVTAPNNTFGAANVILQGTNTYSGGTIASAVTLTIGSTGVLPGGGLTINAATVVQAAGGTIVPQAVTLNGSAILTLTGANSLTDLAFNNNGGNAPNISTTGGVLTLTGGITASSNNVAGVAVITAGTIDLGATAHTFAINQVTFDGTAGGTVISPYTATLNVGAVLQGSGASLIKTGAGILQLSAANTFTGGVDLQAGGLYLANASALGTGPLTVSGNNTSITGTAVTVTNPITWGASATNVTIGNSGGAALVLSGAQNWGSGVTRTITANSVSGSTFSTQTFSGTITGSGKLIKKGPATLVISGNNAATLDWTGSGAVTVNSGLLAINADAALGAAPGSVVTDNITLNGGGLSATASLTLSANRGILLGSASGSGTGMLDAASTFTLTYAGVVADNGTGADGLIKSGAGSVNLQGANTYTGFTTVAAGALRASNSTALGTTAAGTRVQNGAALEFDGSLGYLAIGAETLTLTGTGISSGGALRNISGLNSLAGAITLEGVTRINSDSGTLTLSGNLTGINGATLTVGGVGNQQIDGTINATIGTLTKDGAGTVVLSGANAYTGLTTVSAGALRAQNSTALGNVAAGITVTSGAAVEIDGTSVNGSLTIGAKALTLNGAGIASGGALRSLGGTNSFAGAVTLGAASRINSDAGTLTLTGGVTSTVLTDLSLGGAGNIVIGTAGINTFTGSGLIKDGAGTVTITASSSYSGATTASGGAIEVSGAGTLSATSGISLANTTLRIVNAAASNNGNRIADGATITSNAGSLIFASDAAAGTNYSESLGAFALTGGMTIVNASQAAGGQTSTLTFANLTRTGGALLNFVDNGLGADPRNRIVFTQINSVAATPTVGAPIVLGPWATVGSSFAEYADLGSGVYSIRGLSSAVATGETTWTAFTVDAAPTPATDIALDDVPTSSVYRKLNTLTLSGATPLSVTGINSNALAIKSGLVSGDADHSIAAPFLRLGDGTATADLPLTVSSNSLTISSTIANNGAFAGAITKGGTGTLRLANPTGSNTFTGGFTLLAGTVLVGGDSAFGTGTITINGGTLAADGNIARVVSNAVSVTGDFSLGQAVTNTGSLIFSGNVALGTTSGRIITVDGPNNTMTLSGILSGTGATAFVKSGSGTLLLTGANTFTGNIIVNGGFLAAGSDGSTNDPLTLGSAAGRSITLTNGGGFRAISSINFNSGTVKALTVGSGGGVFDVYAGAVMATDDAGQFLGTGDLTKTGLGTWTVSTQNFSYTGAITVASGILNYGGTAGGSLGASGATQGTTVLSGAEMTLSGAMTTAEPLTLNGTGNMAFGTNGVLGGALVASANATDTGAVTLGSNAGIAATGVNILTLSGVIGDGGNGFGLTKLGNGTLALQGANTYSGATTVRYGTLRLSGLNGSLLNTASLTLNGGTLEIVNTAAANNANRLGNSLGITSALGGGISFNNTAGAANYAETLGVVTLAGGQTAFLGTQNNAGQSSVLTLTGLVRNAGATANFTGVGLGLDTRNALAITGQAAGFIGGWATADNEFAKYDTTVGSVTAMVAADYTTTVDPSAWTAAQNIKLTSGGTGIVSGTVEINSLNLQGTNTAITNSQMVIGAGNILRIKSGGILASGVSAVSVSSIFDGTLTAGSGANAAGELIVTSNMPVNGMLLIGSVIADNGTGAVTVTKAGTGNAVLTAVNTFTGALTVNQGILTLQGTAANASSVVVNPGGTLAVANPKNISQLSAVPVTLNGGTLQNGSLVGRTISSAVTVNNDVILGNATAGLAGGLTLTGPLNLGSTQRILTINNPAASTTNNSGLVTISGPINSTAGFVKAGAGTLSLVGDNSATLTGTIVATAGILRVTADNNLGAATNGLILNGGTLAAFKDLTLSSSHALTMGTSGGTISTATLQGSPTTLTFNGIVDGGALTKTGAGTLVLGGNNTYQGLTTVSAGILRITSSNALGATGLGRAVGNPFLTGGPITTVTAGAALELTGNINVGDESLVLNGTGLANGGALRNVIGNNTWNGQIFINTSGTRINSDAGTLTLNQQITVGAANAALTLGGAGNMVIRGAIATGSTATLTKDGIGTVTLEAANTAGGALAVSGGTLVLTGVNGAVANSSITISNGATLQVNNSTGASNTNRFTAAADPSVTFTSGGTLNFANDSALGNGASANFSDSLGSLIPTSGGINIIAGQAATSQTSVLSFTTLGARGVGATVDFSGVGLGDTTRNRIAFTTTTPALTNGIIGAYATVNGTDFATYDTVAAGGSIHALQTYQPSLNTALTTENVKITAAGLTTLAASRTINTLNFAPGSGGSTLSLGAGTLTLSTNASNTGGLLVSGANAGIISGGFLTAGTALGAELIIHQFATSAFDLQSVVANNAGGAVTLVKAGSGELLLSGNNTFTGGVVLNSGRLTLNNAGALNSTTAQLVTINGGTLRLNGFGAGIASTGISSLGAIIENGSATTDSTVTFTVPIGSSPIYSALMQDGGTAKLNVTKTVSGTITVTSAMDATLANPLSTYTGVTTISGGGLNDGSNFSQSRLLVSSLANVGAASAIGFGDATSDATNAASLVLNGGLLGYTGSAVSSNRLFSLGTTVLPFRTAVTLSTGTGGLDASGVGPLNLTNTGAMGFTGSGARGLILSGSNTADNTLAALIGDGAGGLTSVYKSGTGRWLLTNPNSTYSGGTYISSGTLALPSNPAGVLGVGPVSIQAAATLELNGGTINNQIQTVGLIPSGNAVNGSIILVLADTTIAGAFRGDGGGTLTASDPTINVAPNATLTLAGSVTWAGKNLVKQGDGTLVISPSSYSGSPYGMDVQGGTVRLVGTGSITTSDRLNFTSGVLDISAMQIGVTPATLTFAASTSGNGTNISFGGGAAGGSSVLLLGGNTIALNGNGRTINFSASNNNQGTVIGDVGALAAGSVSLVGATRTFQVADSTGAPVDLTINAAIINGSGTNVGLTKTELGTMLLAGANTYDGATTLTLGTLIADYGLSTASKFSDTGSLTVNTLGINSNSFNPQLGSGTLILQGRNSPQTIIEDVGTLSIGAGYATLQIFGTGTTLRMPSLTRTTVGGLLTYDDLNSSGAMRFATPAGVPTLAAGTVLPGIVTNVGGVIRLAAVNGTGLVVPFTTGTNQPLAGNWVAGDDIDVTSAVSGTVSATLANPLLIDSFRYDAAAAGSVGIDSGAKLGIETGTIFVTNTVAGNALTIGSAGSLLESNNDARDLILLSYSTGPTTLASNIRSDQGITKAGTGSFTLSGNNTYAGNTIINEGALIASGGKAIGDTSLVVLAGRTGALLDIQGNETIAGITSGGNIATVNTGVNVGAGYTLTIINNVGLNYNGAFTGAGSLIKDGVSDFVFNATPNTVAKFTGAVTINRGQLYVQGNNNQAFNQAASWTLNGGSLIIDNNGAATVTDRILNTAPITLYNTGGINGLYNRTDQGGTRDELVGATVLAVGANTITSVSGVTNAIPRITMATLTRQNNATLLVRGLALGDTSQTTVNRGEIVVTGPAPALVGGVGATGSKTIAIVPWALGDLATNGVGNTFVTYGGTNTNGFRPLATGEYETTYANLGANPTSNYSTATTASGLATATANAIRVDHSAGAVTLSGNAAATLTITSGALLFSGGANANAATIDTFAGIATGATNEYVISTTTSNAAAAGMIVTINSPLVTTGASLTKSGGGTLILGSTANLYTGGTNINQGVLQVSSLGSLGTSGGITINGMPSLLGAAQNNLSATLKFGAAFDPSARTVTFGVTGAPTIKTGGGIFDTNGFDITIANPMGNNGNGGFVKAGAGNLTLNAAMTNTGDTFITGGTLTYGVANALATGNLTLNATTVNMGSFSDSVGRITVIGAASILGSGTLTTTDDLLDIQGGTITPTLASSSTTPTRLVKTTSSTVVLRATDSSFTGAVEVQNGTLQFYSLGNVGTNSSLGNGTGDASIRLGYTTTAGVLQFLGGTNAVTNRQLELQGTSGGATIAADSYNNSKLVFTSDVTANSNGDALGAETNVKTLTLQGGTIAANEISGDILETNGTLRVTKTNGGLWNLSGLNNYSGLTTVSIGTLGFSSIANVGGGASALGSPTTVTNGTIQLGNAALFAGLRYTGSANSVTDRVVNFAGTTGTIALESTGSGSVTYNSAFTATGAGAKTLLLRGSGDGIINAGFTNLSTTAANATALTKNGTGTWTLNADTTITGVITVNQGNLTLGGAGKLAASGGYTINGGSLNVKNDATNNVANRLGTKNVTMAGGTLNVFGSSAGALVESINNLAITGGGNTINVVPGGAGSVSNVLNFANYVTPTNGGTLLIKGAGLGSTASATTANVLFNPAPVFTSGIRAEIVGDDGTQTGFVKYDNTNGFVVLSGTDYSALAAQPAGPNFGAVLNTTANVLVNTATAFTTNNSVNSVTLAGAALSSSGGNLAGQNWNALGLLNTLTLTSGGLVAQAGSSSIGGTLTAGANGLYLHTFGNLTVNGFLTGSGGVVKAETGTLNLTGPQYFTGAFTQNAGTVNLSSTTAHTLMVTPTLTVATLTDLRLNSGTLNLNGKNQAVGQLSSANAVSFTGGNVTSAAPATFTASSTTGTTYSGQIGGQISFTKANSSALVLTAPQTYTGTTNIIGGTLTLADDATLASTSINLNYATLLLNDLGVQNIGIGTNPDRIADTATLNMRGGTLNATPLTGASVLSISSETIGTIGLVQGANTWSATNSSSQSTLTVGNLTRTAGSGATLNVVASGGTLGLNAQLQPWFIVNQVNGGATSANQFVGAFAVANSGDYMSYSTLTGLGAYGSVGFPAYTGLQSVAAIVAPTAGVFGSGLITSITATANGGIGLTAPLTVTGALRLAGGFNNDITFTGATDVLDLEFGGLLRSNNTQTTTIGTALTRGVLTGGTAASTSTELIAYNASGAVTIHSVIADTKDTTVGGTGTVIFVKSGAGGLTLTAQNTYTGGTIVNQGTLTLNATGANGSTIFAIQGPLTINGGTVTLSSLGQIKNDTLVTMSGSSVLTMSGSNTLAGLVLNGNGGSGNATAVAAATLVLSSATPITVVNDNIGSALPPTIAGTGLSFTSATGAEINVSGVAPIGASITAPITASVGQINKTGSGSLVLNAANTFTTGLKLTDGALILGHVNALGAAGSSVLTIGDTVTAPTVPLTLLSGTALVAPTNAVVVNRDFTFGGTVAANSLTLAGQVTLNGARTISVASPLTIGTLSGKITGTGGLTKDGAGTLVVSAATNDYNGDTTVSNGLLKLGNAAAVPVTSNVTVSAGGTMDVNNNNNVILRSLAGGGLVTNSGGSAVNLHVGGTSTGDIATASSSVFSGTITNAAGALTLNKVGSGKLELAGASTYAGSTAVKAGQLAVSGSLNGTLSTTVAAGSILNVTGKITTAGTVAVTGTLSGGSSDGVSGKIDGTGGVVNVTGTGGVSPGVVDNGAGASDTAILTSSGLTMATGTHLDISLFNTTAGTGYDKVVTTNGAAINLAAGGGAGTTLNLSLSGYVYTFGDTFFIAENSLTNGSAVSGTFANTTTPLTIGATTYNTINVGGIDFAISYQANAATGAFTDLGSNGNDVALMAVAAVPEPNTLFTLVGSLSVALGLRRFRRRR